MSYAVLISLSRGYPPLMGRLHTRYSPVRRSPPQYCYLVLPLDLHVLGLSLAFILSQDQTLRCKISCVDCSTFIVLFKEIHKAQNNLIVVIMTVCFVLTLPK